MGKNEIAATLNSLIDNSLRYICCQQDSFDCCACITHLKPRIIPLLLRSPRSYRFYDIYNVLNEQISLSSRQRLSLQKRRLLCRKS